MLPHNEVMTDLGITTDLDMLAEERIKVDENQLSPRRFQALNSSKTFIHMKELMYLVFSILVPQVFEKSFRVWCHFI